MLSMNLYNMKPHELDKLDTGEFVLRVPGGWIYWYVSDVSGAGVFVPYSDEFKEKPKKEKPEKPNREMFGGDGIGMHKLQTHIKQHFGQISLMKTQLSYEEAFKLVSTYPKEIIQLKLEAMDNTKSLTKKYVSVYLTLNNWCRMEMERRGDAKPPGTEKKLDMMEAGEKLYGKK